MTAAALIQDLQDLGVTLSVRGDRLHVEAPTGALTPDLRQRLVDRKPELLAALASRDALEPPKTRIVCEYRLNANPSQWLIVLGAPGEGFDHIRYDLQRKYGGRLVQVRQRAVRATRTVYTPPEWCGG